MNIWKILLFVGMLVISNIFMSFAWYGHLKHKNWALVTAIFVSWLYAFFEYVFQVPANRIGGEQFSVTQLKVAQECVTLIVFTAFAFIIFNEPIKWNNLVSMVLIVAAVFFAFLDKI